ncbi:MAG TPA: MBL fold metallo-hydrolase [Ktedonobacteraceae bacterium]|nr:MBL fold metallo-hydrolase [Ktedonobacteraceae bacterium]
MNKISLDPPTLQCYILDTGYCLAWEHHLIAGGKHRRVACHSLVALLHHPDHGWLLWDSGYAPRMLDATRHFPFSLYRRATPLYLDARLSVAAQLPRWGLKPRDIQCVIISHFHADHIAGLCDFPEAKFIATQAAYADVGPRQGLQALRRAFIPTLLPDDFAQRAVLLSQFVGPNLPALSLTHDLFGDGSLLLIALPGHACGQIGMLAHTQRGRMLFTADGAWLRRAIYKDRPPSRLTHFFVDDARAVNSTLHRLHDFSLTHRDVILVPSHCPEAFAQEVGG